MLLAKYASSGYNAPSWVFIKQSTLFEGVTMKTKPMVMLLTMLAGWLNRQQQDVIEWRKLCFVNF